MSINPLVPPACTCGSPAIGCGSRTPSRMMRNLPGRSVTSMLASGRKAMLHGCERPFVTTDTRIRVPFSYVSYVHGPSPSVGVAGCCCARRIAVAAVAVSMITTTIGKLNRFMKRLPGKTDLCQDQDAAVYWDSGGRLKCEIGGASLF